MATVGTKADDLALALEEAIVSGEIAPGTVLRQEQLSEQYQVSRTPVREALRRLAALGLVSFVPNRGVRVRTLRNRLSADLSAGPTGPEFDKLPFTPVYLTDDEWAAELANRTVHAVLHLSWVPDGAGGHRGQMAVLVKPNGLFGTVYMAAIAPFRHLVVYPALMRAIGQRWRDDPARPDQT